MKVWVIYGFTEFEGYTSPIAVFSTKKRADAFVKSRCTETLCVEKFDVDVTNAEERPSWMRTASGSC